MVKNVNELVLYLKEKKWHISFAESLTGGMCAQTLVSVSGASNVLDEAFVTYSNESKMKYLGVLKETIDKDTVFSKEVAYEMAEGLHNLTKAEVCLATTGVAGPNPEGKIPAGYVCFGIYLNGKTYVYEHLFKNMDRNEVRIEANKFIYEELFKLL